MPTACHVHIIKAALRPWPSSPASHAPLPPRSRRRQGAGSGGQESSRFPPSPLPRPPDSALSLVSIRSPTSSDQISPPYLLTPVPMAPCHADRHLAQVSHLLSLEPVQVGLYRRARILEILRSQVEGVFQLSRGVSVNFACQSRSCPRT